MAGLVMLTKLPIPGRVKTRLFEALNPERAAQLHSAFVEDVRGTMEGHDFEFRIAWAVNGSPPRELPGEQSFVQVGNDLGARIFHALSEMARTSKRIGAIGSDHPEISRHRIHTAFRALDEVSVVLGPVEDGGFDLIALRRDFLRPEIFQNVPWSAADTLEVLLDNVRGLGAKVHLLDPGHDVDRPDDLERLMGRLRRGEVRSPATFKLLEEWGWLE